jgi:hypothetical protein
MYNLRMAILRTRHVIRMAMVASTVISTSLLIVTSSPNVAKATGVPIPRCEGTNLVGAFVNNQVATGHVVTTIAITNNGRQVCELGGYPSLIGLRGSRKYNIRVNGHGTYGGNLRTAELAPRMSGALIVSTGDLCGPTYGVIPPSQIYSGMMLVLQKNAGTVQVLGVHFDTTCGVYVSQLGWRSHFWIQGV